MANSLFKELKLSETTAIRGDAKLASERLANAIKNNHYSSWTELNYYTVYDEVCDAPEFHNQMLKVNKLKKVREA